MPLQKFQYLCNQAPDRAKQILNPHTSMKRLYTLLIALIAMTAAGVAQRAGSVEINETNFPDEKFRNFVKKTYDTNGDGSLDETEAAAVTSINISSRIIKNLKGIEFFTALEYLECQNNALTSLDVSKNTALKSLYCSINQLTSLDVSGCTNLKTVYCEVNKLSGDAMTALINSLCDRTATDAGTISLFAYPNDREENVCTTAQVAVIKGKNWKVQAWNVNAYSYEEYAGSEPTAIRNLETSDGTASAAGWYGIDGKKLPAEPTRRGIYIHGGRKVVK